MNTHLLKQTTYLNYQSKLIPTWYKTLGKIRKINSRTSISQLPSSGKNSINGMVNRIQHTSNKRKKNGQHWHRYTIRFDCNRRKRNFLANQLDWRRNEINAARRSSPSSTISKYKSGERRVNFREIDIRARLNPPSSINLRRSGKLGCIFAGAVYSLAIESPKTSLFTLSLSFFACVHTMLYHFLAATRKRVTVLFLRFFRFDAYIAARS